MGRALEPGVRIPMVLDYDKDKPVETRPVFHTVALSMRKSEQLSQAYDDYIDGLRKRGDIDAEKAHRGMVDVLSLFVVGWDNQVDPVTGELIPFSLDAFPDVLTNSEAFELIGKKLSGSDQDADEKKSSG